MRKLVLSYLLSKVGSSVAGGVIDKADFSVPRNLLRLFKVQRWPTHSFKIPAVQAHRGLRTHGEKENTLEALIAAKKAGAKMSEFDVLLSADGVPFLHHDDDLKRVFGDSRLLKLVSAEELDELGVTRLEEVLSHKDVPDYLNIEIKSEEYKSDHVEEKIFDLIKESEAMERVMISSFNPFRLQRFGRLSSEIPLALLVGRGMDWYLEKMLTLPMLNIHMLNLDRGMLDYLWLDFLNEKQIPFSVWTSNDLEEVRFFLKNGAASVISDTILNPEKL